VDPPSRIRRSSVCFARFVAYPCLAFSNRRLVEAGRSAFSKAAKGHHGLWRCHEISAISRSHLGVSGRSSRGTMRGIADSGHNRVAASLTDFRAGFVGSQRSRVHGRAGLSRRASGFHHGWGSIDSGSRGSRRHERRRDHPSRSRCAPFMSRHRTNIPWA
jgi:hypothetical protein